MQTFKATRVKRGDAPPNPHRGQWRIHGRRTAGRVVMVIQEGACWVPRDDGARKDLTAKGVVIWEQGEWVEYGGDGGEGYQPVTGSADQQHRRRRNTDGMAAPAGAA